MPHPNHHIDKEARRASDLRVAQIAQEIIPILSLEGQAFASLPFGRDGRQLFPLHSIHVRDWIVNFYLHENGRAPHEHTVRTVIRNLEAIAHAGRKDILPVYHRIGAFGHRTGPILTDPSVIVLDLANDDGEVILITPHYSEVTFGGPYCFTRGNHMMPQATPTPDPAPEALSKLRQLLNPATTKDWHRFLIWTLAALRGAAACPILTIQGEPGSGKTTAAHMLKRLIDPSQTPFADPNASERQLTNHAHRHWVFALDAVDRIRPRLARFLNSLASGMGIQVREPYDRHEPTSIHLQRPIVLTVNQPLASTGDPLGAKALPVTLAPLTPETRRPETELWKEFQELLPSLLALLCTALSTALRNFPKTKLTRHPNHADAALWATCAAEALGLTPEEILAALDPDPPPDDDPGLTAAVEQHMDGRQSWTGTATQLMNQLSADVLPPTPKDLSLKLRRRAAHYAKSGLTIAFRRTGTARSITITKQFHANSAKVRHRTCSRRQRHQSVQTKAPRRHRPAQIGPAIVQWRKREFPARVCLRV